MFRGFHKNVKQQTVFYIDDEKCFLRISKSSYQNDFWRIMWHLTSGVMMLKTQLYNRNKLHYNRKQLFYIVIIFHSITDSTVFSDQINAALIGVKGFFQKH